MLQLQPHSRRTTHRGTKQKIYVSYISDKQLSVFWNTKTKAELYGNAVLARYYKKLKIHLDYLKAQEKEAKDVTIPIDDRQDESPVPEPN